MAWIYLVLVIILFFTPLVGLGPSLLQQDFEIRMGDIFIPIPFSGSLRLLIYSLLAWEVLWRLTRYVEKRTSFDLFYWIDQQMQFLRLRFRWIYAARPPTSTTLAARLAQIGGTVFLSYIVVVLILGLLLGLLIPQLIRSLLPNVVQYLLAHFPDALWADRLIAWIETAFTNWLIRTVMEAVRDALADLLRLNVFTSLLALSLLILRANREYQRERVERYRRDLKRVREQFKRKQREIVVPEAE